MTKRNHQFTGENEASQIVAWLNSGQSAGRRRIAEIVEIYNKLGTGPPVLWRSGEQKTGPKWTLSLERGAMGRRLQKLLDRYSYKFQWFGQRTILAPAVPVKGDEYQAFYKVPLVHRLRQMNLLSRVMRCDGCEKWMFARVPSKRFCGVSCRVKVQQSSQEWKDRNNAKRRTKYNDDKQNGLLEGRRDGNANLRARKGTR